MYVPLGWPRRRADVIISELMKTKSVTLLCALAIGLAGTAGSAAAPVKETINKATDIVIVRPLGFTSMLVGSVLFVVSLPVTAITKTVKPTAKALVVEPARKTFHRPLGDLDAMAD